MKRLFAVLLIVAISGAGAFAQQTNAAAPIPIQPLATPSTNAPAPAKKEHSAPTQPSTNAPAAIAVKPSTNAAPAVAANPTASAQPSKPRPEPRVPVKLTPPPEFAEPVYVAHRYYEEKGAGWGWIKKLKESWSSAKWVALQETPGKAVAPWRRSGDRQSDHNYEYRFYGVFASYLAYDPHRDETMPVFILKGYEPIGEAPALGRKPGPPMRFTRSKKSGASSRSDRPVLGSGDEDWF